MNDTYKKKRKFKPKNIFKYFGIFILYTFVSSIITIVFYGSNELDRCEIYRDRTRRYTNWDCVISQLKIVFAEISNESSKKEP